MKPANSHLRPRYYRRQVRELLAREPLAILYSLLVVVGVGISAWSLRSLPVSRDQSRLTSPRFHPQVASQSLERHRRMTFFESTVTVQLASTDDANRRAAQRCVERIEQNFERYREGVDEFVDEVTGLRSRLGILKRMPGGWWSGDERVDRYVTDKFERHLFSEASLGNDLRAALEAFREEVRANQQTLLSRTQAAIHEAHLPPIVLNDYEAFFASVNQEIRELAGTEAQATVADGMVTLVISEAGSVAVGMIVGRLFAGLTASTAATVASAGGATAGGAAAGAAGGSVFPGAGTIVGFGVGLVVGIGIDYWMNHQTAAKLRGELMQYIDTIESGLLLGSTSDDSDQLRPQGIQTEIHAACERLRDGVHQRLYEIIVLEQSL